MSIVAPVTVAWQRVTNESTGQAKEIETFSQLEPAIRRAREVILAARDTTNTSFTGSDPEAHLTLHPGDFKYGDALSQRDLNDIYITILPGAITQDASETFPPDSTTNVADLNSFASRVFFAEAEDEFIFDSDVTVRGDFSFQGNILTFKLDGDVQAGFRVEDLGTNRSSSITYNIADEEWTIGDDTRVQGQLHSDSLLVEGDVDIDGNGGTFEVDNVSNFDVSPQSYLLDVNSQITQTAAFYTTDVDNSYNVLSNTFDIQADQNGTVEATNGLLELIGADIDIESTSGPVSIVSADSFTVDTDTEIDLQAGGSVVVGGTDYTLTAPSATIDVEDYDATSTTYTAEVTDEFRIASGSPSAEFVVEPPVNFQSGFQLSGDTTVDDLTVNGDLTANSDVIDLNATTEMTVDGAAFSMNVNDINLEGSTITVLGRQLLSLQSETQIDISAQGQANTQVNIIGDNIALTPGNAVTVEGKSTFLDDLSLTAGALLDVEDNAEIGGDLTAGEIFPNNVTSGNVTYVGSQGQITDDNQKTFAYDDITGTLTVENVDASGGTVEANEVIANSANIGNISLQNATFTSISAQSADLSETNISEINIGEVAFLNNQGHLDGSSSLTFDQATGTLGVFALDVLEDATATDLTLDGFLELENGTPVNEIKTAAQTISDSDDALVTESGILDAVQGGGSKTFGQAVFGGDGSQTQFIIQHGLGTVPANWQVFPASSDATGISHVTADGSKLTVFYDSAPPSGNQNIAINWRVSDGSGSGEEGQASFDGDGSQTSFTVSHGFGSQPGTWQVTANSNDTTAIASVTANASNLTVNFDSAPPTGTGNVIFTWEVSAAGSLANQITFDGDGNQTQFSIPHGLAEKPATWQIESVSPDSEFPSYATADNTNITVVYDSAPPSGTGNVTLNWNVRKQIQATNVVNTVQGGTDITVSQTTGDVTVNHADTGGASNNTDTSTFLNEVSFDSNGHVESVGFQQVTTTNTGVSEEGTQILPSVGDINFTASNDANVDVTDDADGTVSVDFDVVTTDFNPASFVSVSGDTMNGQLTVNDNLTVQNDLTVGGNLVGTAAFRDLFINSSAPTSSDGDDGDVWLETGSTIVETISSGSGISVDTPSGDVTIGHDDTSNVSDSTDNSTAVTGLTFDDFGHVQTVTTNVLGIEVEEDGSSFLTGVPNINFGTGLSLADDGDGSITVSTISGIEIEDDATSIATQVPNVNFGSGIAATTDGDGSVTVSLGGNLGIEIEDDTTSVLTGASNVNFGTGLNASDDGDNTATVNATLSDFTTDDLAEGQNNLYFTEARVDQRLTEIRPAKQDTFSGDGETLEFAIFHGLGVVPQSWQVTPVSDDASSMSHVSADDTNLYVKFDTPPPSGTGNVVLNWLASGTGTTASPTFQSTDSLTFNAGTGTGGGSITNNPPYFERSDDTVIIVRDEAPQWDDREDITIRL